jgi:hypothetical protein
MVNNPSADLGAGKGVVSIWEAKLEARGSARQLIVEMLKKEVSKPKMGRGLEGPLLSADTYTYCPSPLARHQPSLAYVTPAFCP